jgi:hypothetical protein
MPTSVTFNGRRVVVPSVLSDVDASGLEVPALGAAGIVAVMDLGVGGIPASEIETLDDWLTAVSTDGVQSQIRDGDLRELASVMFTPSRDPDIPSGAQQVVLVKVNPAVQSDAAFDNADGEALVLTSVDYGLFTTQIHVTISDGTNGGKKVLIEFEDEEELLDDLGADAKFSLRYNPPSGGAEVATATTSDSGILLEFARTDAGMDTGFTQPAPGSVLEAISANGGDTTQTITVFGLNASNVPTKTAVVLTGAAAVDIGATQWNLVTGASLSAVTAGDVTLRIDGGGASVVVFTAGQTSKGLVPLDSPVEGTFTVVSSGASVKKLVIRGRNAAGTEIATAVTLTGTTPVSVASSGLVHFTQAELGNVEAAQNVTFDGDFINLTEASYPNLQKVKDRLAAMDDFVFVSLVANPKEVETGSLDHATDTSILSATVEFSAVLQDMIDGINGTSLLVEAEAGSVASGAPDNTAGTVYLSGGHEGDAGNPGVPTATTSDWQAAFDKLKSLFVNTIVVGSTDAAVHAQGDAHCAYMAGEGKMERDMTAGAAANETLAALKARTLALNSRHVRLCGQEVKLFDIAGDATWQAPKFQAALVAAMQAGAREVGTPLTNKFVNALDVRQHAGWNPVDDAAEAIEGGLLFMQRIDRRGIKIVRNVTTYQQDSNPAYSEAAVNQAINYTVFNIRSVVEDQIGKKATLGTANAIKGLIVRQLDALMRDNIITGYKAPIVVIEGDIAYVTLEIQPVEGVNFIVIKTKLSRATFAAAA